MKAPTAKTHFYFTPEEWWALPDDVQDTFYDMWGVTFCDHKGKQLVRGYYVPRTPDSERYMTLVRLSGSMRSMELISRRLYRIPFRLRGRS